MWLHDYGSQFGFRLAMAKPEGVAGLVIQNGDIYADAFGPKYSFLNKLWDNPGPASRRQSPSTSACGLRTLTCGELPTTSPTGSAPTCGRCTGP